MRNAKCNRNVNCWANQAQMLPLLLLLLLLATPTAWANGRLLLLLATILGKLLLACAPLGSYQSPSLAALLAVVCLPSSCLLLPAPFTHLLIKLLSISLSHAAQLQQVKCKMCAKVSDRYLMAAPTPPPLPLCVANDMTKMPICQVRLCVCVCKCVLGKD